MYNLHYSGNFHTTPTTNGLINSNDAIDCLLNAHLNLQTTFMATLYIFCDSNNWAKWKIKICIYTRFMTQQQQLANR